MGFDLRILKGSHDGSHEARSSLRATGSAALQSETW